MKEPKLKPIEPSDVYGPDMEDPETLKFLKELEEDDFIDGDDED